MTGRVMGVYRLSHFTLYLAFSILGILSVDVLYIRNDSLKTSHGISRRRARGTRQEGSKMVEE